MFNNVNSQVTIDAMKNIMNGIIEEYPGAELIETVDEDQNEMFKALLPSGNFFSIQTMNPEYQPFHFIYAYDTPKGCIADFSEDFKDVGTNNTKLISLKIIEDAKEYAEVI